MYLRLMRSKVLFSLQEPVYNDSGDAVYVMDQISDKKNREENWIEELSPPGGNEPFESAGALYY